MPRRGLLTFVTTLLATTPAAADHLHPRTPVQWEAGACLTVVDRSQNPILELHYSIPYEDLLIPPEEVPDSRRHQFLALCRDPSTVLTTPDLRRHRRPHPRWPSRR